MAKIEKTIIDDFEQLIKKMVVYQCLLTTLTLGEKHRF